MTDQVRAPIHSHPNSQVRVPDGLAELMLSPDCSRPGLLLDVCPWLALTPLTCTYSLHGGSLAHASRAMEFYLGAQSHRDGRDQPVPAQEFEATVYFCVLGALQNASKYVERSK